jgi:hypothetical protein
VPQFQTGNRASVGHGRPRGRRPDYLAVVDREVSVEAWATVVRRALADAQDGNARARQWLTDMLIPNPAVIAPPSTGLDVETIAELVRQWLPDPEHARRFALAVARHQ